MNFFTKIISAAINPIQGGTLRIVGQKHCGQLITWLLLLLCCTGNNSFATAWKTNAAGAIGTLANWRDVATGAITPLSFTTAGDTWQIQNAMTMSAATWIVGTSGSTASVVTMVTGGGLSCSNAANVITIYGNIAFSAGTITNSTGTITFDIYGNASFSGAFKMTNPPSFNYVYLLLPNASGTMLIDNSSTGTWTYTTITVNAGCTAQLDASFAFNAGTSCTLVLSGTVIVPSGLVFSGTAPLTLSSGGTLEVASATGINGAITEPSADKTLSTGANYVFNGTVAQVTGTYLPAALVSPGSVTINNSAGVTLSQTTSLAASTTLAFTAGNLTLGATTLTINGALTGTSASNEFTGSATSLLSIGGSGALSTLYFNQTTPGTSNHFSTFTMNRAATTATLGNSLNAGTLALTSGTLADGGNPITVTGSITGTGTGSGTGGITMTGSGATISGATLGNLTLNNAGGFSLSGSPTISSSLNFASGILTTGTFTINVPGASGALTGAGASTYVNGTLSKTITGLSSVNYEVGDADFAPMSLALSSAGTAGTLGVKVTSGAQPQASASLINGAQIVTHYWTITSTGATGPTTVTPTATYNASDILGGTNTGFVTQEYAGSAWGSILATTNTALPLFPSYTSTPTTGIALGSLAGAYIFGNQDVPCAAPTTGPTGTIAFPTTTSTGGSVSFTNATSAPTGYVVVASTGALSGTPAYTTPAIAGTACCTNGTIVGVGPGTPVAISSLSSNTTYTISVFDYNNTSCTGGPLYDSAAFLTGGTLLTCPGVAAGITNGTITGSSIGISWTAPANGAASYTVLVYTNSGLTTAATGYSVSYSGTTATVSGLIPNTAYWYTVTANNSACSGAVSASQTGTTLNQCAGTPAPGNTVGTPSSFCVGHTSVLSLQNATRGLGVSYQWYSAPDISGTPGSYSAISGATNTTYSTPAISSTTWYYCNAACSYSSASANSTPLQVVVLSYPVAISGPSNVCNGQSVTLSDATTGGAWSSSNTAVATISGSSGIVTGATVGTATITYTGSDGCAITAPVSVNTAPTAVTISPATSFSVCPGGSVTTTAFSAQPTATVLLSNNFNNTTNGLIGQIGGTWTINNTGSSATVLSSYPTYLWLVQPTGTYSVTGDGTSFAAAYPDPVDYLMVTQLITPSFSTTGFTTGTLSFNQYLYSVAYNGTLGDYNVEIDYSLDGGSTWTLLPTANYLGNSTTYATPTWSAGTPNVTVPLPTAALGQSSVMLRWYYNSFYGYYWFIDNVVLSAGPSELPASAFTWTGPSGVSCPSGCYASALTPAATGINVYTASATYAGCTSTGTVSINVETPPTITAVATPNPLCLGGTLTVNATPAGGSGTYTSYSWSGPGSFTASTHSAVNAGITATGAGVYSVTVTDNIGCTSTSPGTTASVTVNPLPTVGATATPNPVCPNNTLTLTASPAGGSGAYSSYTWTGPGGFTASTQNTTNPGMSGSGVGVYSVTVTDNNGCKSVSPGTTVSVTLYSLPAITAATTPGALCAGATLTLNATPSGGSGIYFSYSWNGPGSYSASGQNPTNAGITAAGAGAYSVTVTDSRGCTSATAGITGAVTVNPLPAITATATPTALCAATTLTLNATPVGGSGTYLSFAWQGPGSFTSSARNTTNAGITAAGAGIYSVTVTDNNGCTSVPGGSTAPVTVNALPTVGAAATPNPVCPNNTLTLTATPAGGSGTYSSYTWTGPGGFSASTQNTTNPGMSGAGVGIYSISVTDNNGCTAASVGATASVSLYTLPVITATATPLAICSGSNLSLSSTPGGGSGTYSSFSWNGPGSFTASAQNATNAAITAAGAGIYSVTVTDNHGCISVPGGTTAAVTVNALPNITNFTVPSATTLCLGGTSTVTVNSSSLASATFTVTYNLSGANTVTAHSAILVMSAGTGTFIIPSTDLTTSGSTTITVTSLTNANGCISSLSTGNSVGVLTNPLPKIINGAASVCLLSVITLSDTTTSGTWSSSNTVVAIIGSSTGSLTGTTIGTATITYTIPTGCFITTLENVNPIPNVYTVTGGGTFCSSSPTVHVGLSNSDLGASYQVYIGGIATGGLITGTGSMLDLGLETVSGFYTVIANPSATCARTMAGSVTVLNNLSPSVFTVTGGGSLCTGGAGVAVGMNYGQPGMTYQLYNGVSTAGSAVTGTGYSFNFGFETAAGTYTVIATNPSGLCTTAMTGSAAVAVNPLPPAISGTASVCGGLTTALSDGTTGGAWSSGSTGLATVGSSSGIVGGVSAGLPMITYTLPTGCITSRQITVNPAPAPPGGASANVCSGSAITLTDAASGGTWSSSSTAAATIGSSSGIITGGLTAGAITVTYTLPAGCSAVSTITINSLPAVMNVTGGGSYCSGSGGAHVGLSSSVTGVSYQLYLGGATASGSPVAGTGLTLDFGPRTAAGAYTAVATNSITGCSSTMSGSAIVAINPLPAVYALSGGGSYCSGLPGVDVSLGLSSPGISYQLFDASTPIGGAVSGTGASYDFGLQTAGGVYGAIATNSTTGCTSAMSGSVVVTVLALPAAYPVTGGGSYCSGGTGVHVLLSSSAAGINYQVYNGGSSASGIVAGTSGSIDFGAFTATGIYTVSGTNAITGCSGPMSGSVTVTTNPLPVTTYSVTGGGGYCAGALSTSSVGLSGSVSGATYQLYVGSTPVGIALPGTGGILNFGIQSTAGAYTVIGTTAAGCTGAMSGSATIAVNPLPAVFSITGGGSYCTGSAASVHVGLNGSATGVSYQLYNSGVAGAVVAGTGSSLDFGALPAGSYTIKATSGAGCVNTMSGSASVTTNPLPAAFAVSITPGSGYCAGSAAPQVLLSGSVTGVTYQLVLSGGVVGAQPGTGASLNFGPQAASGSYTATATTTATGCSSTMTGSATVIANVLPTAYTVTGGGAYCAGGTGLPISLSSSLSGVSYQLYIGGIATGAAVAGSGTGISFPAQTATGSYTVIATNTATSCSNNMTGSVSVSTTPLPVVYNVTGGGAYCAGTTTGVHVGLSASNVGFSYQLLFGGATAVGLAVAGTGSALDFGAQATTGSYTVVSTNSTTLCTSNMFGSAVVSTVSYPTAYAVSASGSYCSGGAGFPVTLGSSDAGVSYQLLRGGVPAGSPVAGTGSGITFGNQTVAGNYTVFGTNATGCGSNMTGIAAISINPLPTVFTVTGTGTVYCTGDTGVHIGLNSSLAGFSYQLYNGGVMDGVALAGTGSALDYGRQTAGVYTISARNNSTSCTNNMSGMIVVTANPLPAQYAVTGGGNYCSGSAGVAVGLGSSDAGISYQLYLGSSAAGAAVAGTTGLPLNFGLQTATGAYTVKAINTATGCTQTMTGSAAVGVSTLPALHNVSGGGNYCTGGTGVDVYIDGSNTGVSYQLYNGTTPTGTAMAGTGTAVHFGLQTAAGAYTVAASGGAACTDNMTGSVTVTISPLPVVYTVTGGGNYCPSGTGVHVGLSGSDGGVQYQLFNGTAMVGAPFTGMGSSIDFGLQTGTGAYTVVGTNPTTTCTNNMSGIVTIGLAPLPAVYNVTGGGSYCAGGTGMTIGTDGSAAGIAYQLYQGITPVSGPLSGTGFPIGFGLQTTAGIYTVIATNTTTACNSTMSGSAAIIINPLPDTFSVTGGGQYCAGTGGVGVGLRSSEPGVSYQLYQGGIATGISVSGTGAAISFGAEIAAGAYTAVATNTGTACSSNMPGSALVAINPLPVAYAITGGGNYCPGGAGMHIGLSSSAAGITYQLYNGTTPTGITLPGTGAALDFGLITAPGTYYVTAINTATSCTNNMAGSAAIGISALPTAYTVSSSAAQYCAGGEGVNILLSGSATGANYQLYSGAAATGSLVTGTGVPLNFGMHTAGTYTVVATTIATGCVNNMIGSATVTVNPLPAAYAVAGGGNYCPGGSGVHVGLAGTTAGISYQLYNGIYTAGSAATGTGSAIDFGLQAAAGTYTVAATNTLTGCSSNMTGSATVGINPLPAVNTVTGGGNYCVSGSGVAVGLSGSGIGVTYQLYFDGSAIGAPVAGTGALLGFGLQTAAGIYTAVATSSATGCSSNMAGSAVINTNSLPPAYPISSGGSYCAGGPGFDISLANSTPGVNYQLYNGLVPSGIYLPGTGFPLDFGIHAAAGSYTLVGTNITTGCTSTMTGTAAIIVNPLPAAYSVTGGGNYCASGSGVHIGLSNSQGSITYQLFSGTIPYGLPVPGTTGSSLDFGLLTAVGAYSVVATNPVTGCSANMTGTATVAVSLPVVPSVTIPPGTDTLCDGTTATINTSVINGGTTPTFSWTVNGIAVSATSGSLTYAPAVGDVVGVTMTSSAVCASPATATYSLPLAVLPHGMPSIFISSSLGDTVCQGASVTFTQVTAYSGGTPSYSWMVNGTPSGSTASYIYTPANGDLVACVLTSDYRCRLATSVYSNPLNLVVDEPVTPAVTVTASPGTSLPQGQVLSLMATVANAVIEPSYQWYINGEPVPGAVGTVYSTTIYSNLDSFSCIVTSGGGCSGLKGSGSAVIHLANEGVQQVTSGGSDIRIAPNPNNGIFSIKGTIGTTADEEVSVEITDMLGQVIYKDKVMARGGNIDEQIQLGNALANGMYMLSIHSASANDVFHVVIEQ